jgi:hypothetical protein
LIVVFAPVLIVLAVVLSGSFWAVAGVFAIVIALLIAHERALFLRPLTPTTAGEAADAKGWSRSFAQVAGIAAVVVLCWMAYRYYAI